MKSNNNRYWFIPLLLAAAFVIAFFLWRQKSGPDASGQTTSAPASKLATPSPATTPAPVVNVTTPMVDPIYEAVKAEREQKLRDMADAPIDFFGKVVDGKGNPVMGASTFYIVGSFSFEGSPTLQGPATDAAGLFSITEKRGPDFSVRVEHSDYYKTSSADQQFEYAHKAYVPGKEPPSPPTKGNPAVFVLKKKGLAEALVHHQRIKTKLPMNAAPVTINARSGQAGGGNEVISITLRSDGDKLPLNTFHPFDWSVTIEASGGGIVERSDALDFEAPADGYVTQQTINMSASLPKDVWKSDIQRDYFIKFGSGNYGRVRLNISGDKGRSIAEVFLNPTPGSRKLEFDPKKVVKSP